MNVLDAMAFAIIAISIWGAITKGLIVELISLASVILGFVLAGLYYDVLDGYFLGIASPPRAAFFAFIAIFLGVIVIGMITAALLNKIIKKLWLKWLDRLLGAFFGLVRGWLIVSIIFLAFAAFGVQRANMARSRTAAFFLDSARLIVFSVPDELKEKFSAGYQKAFKLWIRQEK
ncbi:MAG: CvpA family protein [Acidobacteria bacterium]|nr:MAG: CvpA family protein [Acidobacteriota bacterium]